MSLSKQYAVLGIYALFLWLIAWFAYLQPAEILPIFPAIVLATAPILPSVLLCALKRPSAVFWGGVAALLYFCHAISEFWAGSNTGLLASVELTLAIWIIFCGNWDGLQAKLFRRKGVK